MVYVKVHKGGGTVVVAVCDEDLLGKTLKGGSMEVVVSEEFYKGEVMSDEDVLSVLKRAENVNLLGEHAIRLGIKAGLVSKKNVLLVDGVPHAQIFCV